MLLVGYQLSSTRYLLRNVDKQQIEITDIYNYIVFLKYGKFFVRIVVVFKTNEPSYFNFRVVLQFQI